MTIVQLEYLLAVANYSSFSIASEKCFVTQPSLSMQIKNLEDELGVVLFDRTKKPLMLTEIGRLVVEKARVAIKEFYEVKEQVSQLKGEISGVLRLGVIPTIAPYILHKFIPTFTERYPDVTLEIKEMITPDIVKSLYADSIDVAILAGGTPEDIKEELLFEDRFHAYVSDKHAFSKYTDIPVSEIDLDSLLLLPEGHCLRDQVLDLCKMKRERKSRFLFESGSLDTLMRLVDSTDSMTIIPEMSIESIPIYCRQRVHSLGSGRSSRPITIAVRWTYVKRSLIEALRSTVIEKCKPK